MLPMFHPWKDFPFGGSVTGELVGDDRPRDVLPAFEQLAEELPDRLLVTAMLHQDIEGSPMLIHCSPGIGDLAMDGEEDVIQIPLVPGARLTVTQGIGIPLTKLQTSLANCFVGQLDASLGHDLFDVAVAQGEVVVQPNTITDDLRGKGMTFVEGRRRSRFHTPIMPKVSHIRLVLSASACLCDLAG